MVAAFTVGPPSTVTNLPSMPPLISTPTDPLSWIEIARVILPASPFLGVASSIAICDGSTYFQVPVPE